jgi:GNAT superfamily N-acetyltransferase
VAVAARTLCRGAGTSRWSPNAVALGTGKPPGSYSTSSVMWDAINIDVGMIPMVAIRAAVAADADALSALLAQLDYPSPATAIPARLQAVAADGGIVLVACDDRDRILGFASGACHATIQSDTPTAYVTALVTMPEARGRGIGRQLLATLEQWARERGCRRIAVTSAERRADAHAFYPRCGFPYTGRRFTKSLDASAS